MGDGGPPVMSDAECAVLKVLWEHGPLAVRDVVARLAESGQRWARSTVITLLQRLEKKGYVASDKSQFAFVFRPVLSREDVMRAHERPGWRVVRRKCAAAGSGVCRAPPLFGRRAGAVSADD